eukprot:TRINITY_DN15935_c0_g1_i1.p1 TRINITY_DN15935_c0_g1~~TRINITY_DN15935_c0_g1_i1.p1  ORF type:complete len:495 (-),score=85.99 TRINITY_DN15935_c0_g1_i1:230-1714(-)
MAAPSTSLYVGDLAPTVNEAVLYSLFSAVAPVVSIRVCRDRNTGQSLGYGYANFQQPTDAQQALEALNYHPVHGRPIRLMWQQRDPNLRRTGKGNIVVKNLHSTIDAATLHATFARFGQILSTKVESDPVTGESRGFGFVHFVEPQSAAAAIAAVHGMEVAGQRVAVEEFHSKADRIAFNRQQFTKLHVRGFKRGTPTELIRERFAAFGEVAGVTLHFDNRGQAFCVVEYDNHLNAEAAVEALHEQVDPALCGTADEEGGGQPLFVQRALTKAERLLEQQRQRTEQQQRARMNGGLADAGGLYVGNLADDVDDESLARAFERFGEITRCEVVYWKDKPTDDPATARPKSRGFGFVCLGDPAAALVAQREMNGTELNGRALVVNTAFPKGTSGPSRPLSRAANSAPTSRQQEVGTLNPFLATLPAAFQQLYRGGPSANAGALGQNASQLGYWNLPLQAMMFPGFPFGAVSGTEAASTGALNPALAAAYAPRQPSL